MYKAMKVTPTLDDARAFQQLTLADEHLMICVCGVDQDADARMLQEAMLKIVRIKMQMGGSHQISLATVQGSRLDVKQECTKDVNALVAAMPGLFTSAECDSEVDLDALLADVARYFDAQRKLYEPQERQSASPFRLLVVYRQVKQRPSLQSSQGETSRTFINDPVYHLDVIYWHQDVLQEAAQSAFNQFCAYDNTNPFAKFYFLEVGQSLERLHQALVLMLSHPAHRMSQNAAEQLLGSWFSPSKRIDSQQG